jgi:hypothetical protein
MKKNSVGLLELETAVLEFFLEKTPLSPLGVKIDMKGKTSRDWYWSCKTFWKELYHNFFNEKYAV